jgi:hypothetical protein
MGLKIMSKSKNRPMKWQFFHENHQLSKVVEMKGTDDSFVPLEFSRIGTARLKNWSGKCEGSGRGIDGLKNRSGKCEGPGGGGGVDEVKNQSGKCKGLGRGWGTNGCLKRKVFLKNQKHQLNIVEITHLYIMHGVHTSRTIKENVPTMSTCPTDGFLSFYFSQRSTYRLQLFSNE